MLNRLAELALEHLRDGGPAFTPANLVALRRQLNQTQPDFGVSRQTVAKWEDGLRKPHPSPLKVFANLVTKVISMAPIFGSIGKPSRHGLMIGDVEDVIAAAIGGQNITRTIEGRERYPVNVRYEQGFRDTLPDLQRVLVKTPAGAHIPLAQLAEITLTPGPAMIRDQNGQLAGYVYVDTATTDIGGSVEQAKRAIDEHLNLPGGSTLLWTGQYEFQVRARERFKVLIPLVFFVNFMLLYMTFYSASEATIVMLSVVYAMTGGVILQWLLSYNLSVAVWVGYIALYGVAVQTGVVMVVYLHEALDRRLRRGGTLTEADIREATMAGSVLGLRPKLMTVSVVMAALVPILWSTGVGLDIMKPIAAPIIGGMVTSTIHVLIITPVIFYLMKTRALRRGTLRASAMHL